MTNNLETQESKFKGTCLFAVKVLHKIDALYVGFQTEKQNLPAGFTEKLKAKSSAEANKLPGISHETL